MDLAVPRDASRLIVCAHPEVSGRLLGCAPDEVETLAGYRATGGYAPRAPDAVLAQIDRARLRGRGGAGFPAAVKLRAIRQQADARRTVVANGEEGEPAAAKDRYLLRTRPHLVLDGLWRCAEITGADRAFVYVSDPAAASAVRRALEELGEHRHPVPTSIHLTERSYVAGEETAVVRAIDGGPAKPTAKPPRPYEHGVGGHPTLVQNVETLAHIALIAAHGDDAHLRFGTTESTGTTLFSISRPGLDTLLVEAPLGATLRELIGDRPIGAEPGHVLMGGFFGGIHPASALALPLSFEALASAGSGLGCAAIVVLGADACPVATAAEVMSYFAVENADQCGVCVKGTAAMRDVLVRLTRATPEPEDGARLERWASTLGGRGACATIDAAAHLARTLLDGFGPTVEAHRRQPCGICSQWRFTAPRTDFAIEMTTEGGA